MREDRRVAVRACERDGDEVALADRAPAELARRASRSGRPRRRPARAGATPRPRLATSAGSRRDERACSGCSRGVQERVRDHRLGRLDAAEQQHGRVRGDLPRDEPVRRAGRRRDERRAGSRSSAGSTRARRRRERLAPATGGRSPAVIAVTSRDDRGVPAERDRRDRSSSSPSARTIDRDRERAGERCAAGRPRPSRSTASISRSTSSSTNCVNAPSNGVEPEGARERDPGAGACSTPSSESMLGPTTRAVEKRGSSTVNVSASRITSSARSRRGHEPGVERREPGDGLRARAGGRAAGAGRCSSSASVTAAPSGKGRGHARHDDRLPAMATTATERQLLIDGEWVETGEWVEIASPYDGSPVARVAKAGAGGDAARARRSGARDGVAAPGAQARRDPRPCRRRARTARGRGRPADLAPRRASR